MLTAEQLESILESGIQAPSADNRHRLMFETDQDGINILYTGGKLPKAGGYQRVLVLLSLGAVSENLTIAAGRFGIGAECTLFLAPHRPDLAVRVDWRHRGVQADPLWMSIPKRHTNRRLVFRGPPLGPRELAGLSAQVASSSGCDLVWLDGSSLRPAALKLLRLAEAERFRNPLLHRELFSSIRFDVGWHSSCDEGLPPGALGIERPLRPVFSALAHWPRMRMLNRLGAYRMLGWRAADLPCRLAPHLGVITTPTADDVSVFAAGRAFQRVWLAATARDLALQPMPAAALYALEGARSEGIPGAVQQRLEQGWIKLVPGRRPVLLFRMGRATPLPVTAGRKAREIYIGPSNDSALLTTTLILDVEKFYRLDSATNEQNN